MKYAEISYPCYYDKYKYVVTEDIYKDMKLKIKYSGPITLDFFNHLLYDKLQPEYGFTDKQIQILTLAINYIDNGYNKRVKFKFYDSLYYDITEPFLTLETDTYLNKTIDIYTKY